MASATAKRRSVRRVEVLRRRGDRDPLTVPERYRKPGKAYRWVRVGDSPSETQARIEEMEDLGYRVVQKGDKDTGAVQHRNMMLFETDQRAYVRRQEEKVRENVRSNKSQAKAIREQMRARVAESPDGRVLERGLTYGQPEELITTSEHFVPAEPGS